MVKKSINETNAILNNTNITVEVYTMGGGGPPSVVGSYSNLSNESGYFSVNVTQNSPQNYFYRSILRHFNETTQNLDYIGQSLPQFPHEMISMLTAGSPMNFYLRRSGTININAVNETGANQQFRYMIKDTRLGYPIAENFSVEVENANNIYVPLERSYSIMIFPNQSLPVSYDLDNLSAYPNNTANITFNTSIRLRRVSGNASLSNGSTGFNNLSIISYLMEPGNMIGKDHPMPANMSAFDWQNPGSDMFDATNGSYKMTLPGSAMGGGKISMRIKMPSQGITVHYRNVDMIASGPPDAMFDDSASQTQSGSSVEQAWRFGSKGPEIYDEVLIGVPISSSISISGVKLGKLYDENWGTTWQYGVNSTGDIPSDYSGFNSLWFTTGMSCSTSNVSSECYIDSANNTLWLRIPHFSGVGPTIVGTTSSSSSSSGGGGSTGGFSSFAIVAMKASESQAVPGQTGANVTATVAGQAETTNAPLTAPKETPGFEPMLAVFALCAVYLLGK